MACYLRGRGDRPLTPAQFFTYLRHRYDGLPAYYLPDRDIVVVPVAPGPGEVFDAIRETAARQGLACSLVSAAWPEFLGPGDVPAESASEYLVVAAQKPR